MKNMELVTGSSTRKSTVNNFVNFEDFFKNMANCKALNMVIWILHGPRKNLEIGGGGGGEGGTVSELILGEHRTLFLTNSL